MKDKGSMLKESRSIIAAVIESHRGGFTLDADDLEHMEEFLEESKRFVP